MKCKLTKLTLNSSCYLNYNTVTFTMKDASAVTGIDGSFNKEFCRIKILIYNLPNMDSVIMFLRNSWNNVLITTSVWSVDTHQSPQS